MSNAEYFLATIDAKYVSRSKLDWLTTKKKPFRAVDMFEIIDTLIDPIFAIYKATYTAKVGQKLYIAKKEGLLKYNRWVVLVDGGNIIGFALYHDHPCGIKLGLTGCKDIRSIKKSLIIFQIKAFSKNGVFGEISPPIELVLDGNVPTVKSRDAEKVLKKYRNALHELAK